MIKKKEINEQIKYKKNGKLIKKDNQEVKELPPNYIQKLKVNLSSSLKFIAKKKNLKKEKSMSNSAYLLNQKIILKNLKKYNSESNTKNIMIISNLINCKSNHYLAVFKDYLIIDYVEEFLRRIYFLKESIDRLPKLYIYYKNYLQFFCKPTFIDSYSNMIIKNYGDYQAENFYKINIEKKNKDKNKINNDNNNNIGNIGYEENNNDDNINENLIKTIFTKSIKNSIDNININCNEEYSINKTKEDKNNLINDDFEYNLKQESSIKIDKNNKISEGNTLILMINEMKEYNNKKKTKTKTINIKKNISRNKNISNESYKTLNINNTFNNNKIKKSLNNYNKKKINTNTNIIKHADSIKNIDNDKTKKGEKLKIKKNMNKIEKIIKNNHNSIIVNINKNINSNQNENIIKNNYKSPRNNINKIKFPLSPLILNILNDKELPKKNEPLTSRTNITSRTNRDKVKKNNYIKIINRKKFNDNIKILTTTNKYKKKFDFNKIKSLDSLDINSNEFRNKPNNSCNKEIISYNYKQKSPKKKNKIKYRNNNNDFSIKNSNFDLLTTFNKTTSSSTKNFGTKVKYVNSVKNLIKVNEIKNNKRLICKNIKNNKGIYSPLNKINYNNRFYSYKRINNMHLHMNTNLN